ncbi:Nuclear GTPase SLIP-GC [Channa argus]|uniref:Nuclear GTPase SLIP-GC n=1 Tax=Channa argus TaxID=215402 RepID=A0A6G1QCN0_CHAAH|nr:Nuclear GTPase SLIP-GC [Channa argus]
MDDFVCNKLTEWGLTDWIVKFKDQGIDKESFECLEGQEINDLIPIVGPRAKFKKRLKALKRQQRHEETADSAQVLPSTSDIGDKGKRKLDHLGECSNIQSPPRKQQRASISRPHKEQIILSDVKTIMKCTYERLHLEDETKLNAFLKSTISDLDTDKRELVGVFGKTGAGKSFLINAIIEEKDLLPSGSISACTTVMIKVEANMLNLKYEAEIEFITKEEWKDELWYLYHILGDKADEERDEDYCDTVEKLSAVYGEEWKNKSPENLMDIKYFREIPEFLCYRRKILTCESAKELSAKFVKYTRSDSKEAEVRRWYWPLVKCVTVRVPCNSLLQHVTLVDLPGNGDRNKSRDTMWKGIVGNCSTVWIVTEINRAAAEREPWEILESASSLMGNGGECQHIHFICTKSDLIEDSDDDPATARALLFKRNMKAKEEVSKQFNNLNRIKKHFSDDCFRVFTVSSKEFLKPKRLNPDDTEIPKLQEFLQNLNDCHSETLNYVSRAHGILSLIQGARSTEVPGNKKDASTDLEEKIRQELKKVRESMEETYSAFEKCLNEGVDKSKTSCDANMKPILHPIRKSGRGYHKILTCVVENGGVYKRKKGKPLNLNLTLSSCLTESIDEEFRKTFPNEGKCGPFNGVISMFSLNTEKLIEKYKHLELQLTFLQTEEEKIKTKLNKIIRDRKKKIYTSLIETIEETMQECYKKAVEFRGPDKLKNMRDTIELHVHDLKNVMFEKAKDVMLNHLMKLMEKILETLEKTLNQALEISLKTDGYPVPVFSKELELVKQYYKELKPDE